MTGPAGTLLTFGSALGAAVGASFGILLGPPEEGLFAVIFALLGASFGGFVGLVIAVVQKMGVEA